MIIYDNGLGLVYCKPVVLDDEGVAEFRALIDGPCSDDEVRDRLVTLKEHIMSELGRGLPLPKVLKAVPIFAAYTEAALLRPGGTS